MTDVAQDRPTSGPGDAPEGVPSRAPEAFVSRRSVMAMAAGGLLVVAGLGSDAFAVQRGVFATGTGEAYEPWRSWDRSTAPVLGLVQAGILAANAHNAQAWRFAVGADRVDVYEDTRRSLGTVDAFRREVQLSAGCAVENIVLAARAAGLTPTVVLSPAGDPALLARVGLTPGPTVTSPLYQAIPHRHTDRAQYQKGRDLPPAAAAAMDALGTEADVRVQWLLTAEQKAAFSALTVAATQAFIADVTQSTDDNAWYRATWAQLQSHRDGITVDASGLSPLLRALGKVLPSSRSSNDGYWLAGTRDTQLPTASGFGIVLVRDAADAGQRVNAGRLYQRLHLWAVTQGLAMQPLNQSVERAERERVTSATPAIGRGLDQLIGDKAWQPVMPFRIGYPTVVAPPSPRRAVSDVLVSAA